MQQRTFARFVSEVDTALTWAPSWLAGTGVLVGSAIVPVLYNRALRLLGRPGRRFGALPQLLIEQGRRPLAASLTVVVLGAAFPAAHFTAAITLGLAHALRWRSCSPWDEA